MPATPDSWAFDASTFWVMLGITVLEGLRRVPEGSYVARHVLGYPWHVAGGPTRSAGWRLVSLGSPFAVHVVLAPEPAAPGELSGARLPHGIVAALRLVGALVLAGLLVALPTLTPTFGVRGLAAALAGLFSLSLVQCVVLFVAFVRRGVPRWKAFQTAVPALSPFAAPRAAEMLLETLLAGRPPAESLRVLLPPEDYHEWVRPAAFDIYTHPETEPAAGILSRADAERVIRQPPAGCAEGENFCPRCGGVYLPTVRMCHRCPDVELLTADGVREVRMHEDERRDVRAAVVI